MPPERQKAQLHARRTSPDLRTFTSPVTTSAGRVVYVAGFACIGAVIWWGGLWGHGIFAVVLQLYLLAVGSGLLLINGLFSENRASRFLAHRLWSPLARLSYGIYLIHPFAAFWVIHRWPNGAPGAASSVARFLAFTAVVLVVAVCMAAALYLGVEHPMLERGARLSRRYMQAAERVSQASGINDRGCRAEGDSRQTNSTEPLTDATATVDGGTP
jgi:peptidoglycan/LPS O-acetylase OafA/YrhL